MRTKLALNDQFCADRLDRFLLLEPRFDHNLGEVFARRALGVYATFMATNRVRKGLANDAEEVWHQMFKEGASSHKKLLKIIREIWTQ